MTESYLARGTRSYVGPVSRGAATTPASCRARGRKEGRDGQARFSLHLFLTEGRGGRGGKKKRASWARCGVSWPRDRRRAVGHCAFFVSPIRPRALSVSLSAQCRLIPGEPAGGIVRAQLTAGYYSDLTRLPSLISSSPSSSLSSLTPAAGIRGK